MRKQNLLFFVLLTPFLSLPGCSGNSAPPVSVSSPAARAGQAASMTQQLNDIVNNPNMPPAAKAAAKANIQQHQTMDLSAGHK